MSWQHSQETAYAICIDDIHHHYVYFRTISKFCGIFGEKHGRDIRHAEPVISDNFDRIMLKLRQTVHHVSNDSTPGEWIERGGWALIPRDLVNSHLNALLDSRECVKSAIGLFWDAKVPRNRAANRRVSRPIRKRVLARDHHRCVECGRAESAGATLTMDHVIPFSRGGETTVGNLVTLCSKCNQMHGNAHHPHLFALANLHHDWDPQLLDAAVANDPEGKHFAITLSQNIMVSRCRKVYMPGAERIIGRAV